MLRLDSSAVSSSNLPAFNLSLNCWLHILSQESSLDQHGDSSNLPVGLSESLPIPNVPEPRKCLCHLSVLKRDLFICKCTMSFHPAACFPQLRVLIALVYLVVCVLGLVGNLLALLLLHSNHRHHSSIDCFVMSLALTDLQFVLTLPFWAVDTALDFRWPFGRVMCKMVSSVTALNMYASVFFLTAMSVTRYRTLVTSLRMESPEAAAAGVKWASLAIWMVSLVATLPHAIYSTTVQV